MYNKLRINPKLIILIFLQVRRYYLLLNMTEEEFLAYVANQVNLLNYFLLIYQFS